MKKGMLIIALLVVAAAIAATAFFARERDETSIAETAGQAVSAEIDTYVRTNIETRKAIEEKAEGKYSLNEITNVLLIGVDNNNVGGLDKFGNADGIMLVSINSNTKQLTLTSFMRDTRIRQPREYEKKITEIYHAGGAKLLIEAIEQSFGIHIDNYILVNYLNVIDIVDALGGLDIELSADEIQTMAGKIRNLEILTGRLIGENALRPDQAGMLHLNGVQTSAYLRIRPSSTNYDSGRTARARKVVTLILEKVKKMSTGEKSAFADTFIPKIETDMSDADILAFSMSASFFMDFELFSAKIPLDGAYKDSNDGNAYIIPDFEVNNKYLYESIYEGKHGGSVRGAVS